MAAATASKTAWLSATNAGRLSRSSGGIAGHGQLGEDGQVGAAPLGLGQGVEDAPGVAARSPTTVLIWHAATRTRAIGVSLPAALPGLFWLTGGGREPEGPSGRGPPAGAGPKARLGRPLFILRSQSGNGGETARCDSGVSVDS